MKMDFDVPVEGFAVISIGCAYSSVCCMLCIGFSKINSQVRYKK